MKWMIAAMMLMIILLNVCAQALFKKASGTGIVNLYGMGGVISYGLSTVLYLYVLKSTRLSVVYPIVIGLSVFGTVLVGLYIYNESMATREQIGVWMIMLGIILVSI